MKKAKNHYFEDVYAVTALIPKGRVTSYGAIADYLALGSARMVGWALTQSHQFPLDIPAHRVVNSQGYLTGKLHFGEVDTMELLLKSEGILVKNNKIQDFEKYFWHPRELEMEDIARL